MIRLPSFRISPLRIIRSRPLRPFARRLLDRGLWKATPHAMGIGLAIGFFFGILIPFGQILFAVALAVCLRGNLLTAAMGTLISNPLTFPPIYYAAWQTGKLLKTLLPGEVVAEATHLADETHVVTESLLGSMGAASGEVFLGLLVLAPLAALAGYLLGRSLSLLRQGWRKTDTNRTSA